MSTNNFSMREIFEIAEQIERNGAEFYNKAAEMFKDCDDTYKLLKKLEEEEKYHEDVFKRYQDILTTDESACEDLDELSKSYLDALADQYVFNQQAKSDAITGKTSKYEIYLFAIAREKDAILLYTMLKDSVKSEEDKNTLEIMIREEKRHLMDLTRYRENFEK